MPGLALKVILQDIKKLETDALIVGFYEDVRPLKGLAGELDWLLCGSLSNLILSNKLSGSLGDVALLTSRGKIPAQKIFMVGLGPARSLSSASLRRAARTAASSALSAGVAKAALEYFPAAAKEPSDATVHAHREGLTDGAGGRRLHISLLATDAAAYEKLARIMKG